MGMSDDKRKKFLMGMVTDRNMKAITHWHPYLIWTKEPFTILTDHINLLHWKSPRKLNRCTARWHGELQDYNFKLQHVPGKLHTAADALSQPPGADEGKDNNQQITMILEAAFIRLAGPDSNGSIEHTITIIQNHNHVLMDEWERTYPIEHVDNPDKPFWRDIKNQHLVIPQIKAWNENWWTYGTKDLSMATLDKTKLFSASIRNTFGLVPELGSQSTSKAAQRANKTKTPHTTSNPQHSAFHQ
jgi:hypothetical protein